MRAPARSLLQAFSQGCGRCVAAVLLAGLAACDGEAVPNAQLQRQGRLGSLRDLVLFERPGQPMARALFVDRFEVTRGDWTQFAATTAGREVGADLVAVDGDAACPVAGVSFRQAQAFAQWRCLRLPTRAEWELAATGGGRSLYPWGDRAASGRANTGELGLLAVTPVGTFESGRRAGGDQPYDLIGNVSEWTQSVPARWFLDELDPSAGLPRVLAGVRRCRSLSVWGSTSAPFPAAWLVQMGGDRVLREVVGADFQTTMARADRDQQVEALVESVPAGDRRQRTGLRLCGSATDLVAALCACTTAPTPAEVGQLQEFVRRDGHRQVLAAAFEKAMPQQATAFARLLAEQLGIAVEPPR